MFFSENPHRIIENKDWLLKLIRCNVLKISYLAQIFSSATLLISFRISFQIIS